MTPASGRIEIDAGDYFKPSRRLPVRKSVPPVRKVERHDDKPVSKGLPIERLKEAQADLASAIGGDFEVMLDDNGHISGVLIQL